MDKDFADFHDRAKLESNRLGYEYVKRMNLADEVAFDASTFAGLPSRPSHIANRMHKRLSEKFADQLPRLIALAVKELWYAAATAAFYMKICSGYKERGYKVAEFLWDPVGYADYEGWSYTLYDQLSNIEEDPEEILFRRELQLLERPAAAQVLDCIALHFFARASAAASCNDFATAMNCLGEAGEACALSDGLTQFDSGFDLAKSSMVEEATSVARNAMARTAAAARHRENHAMKTEVFSWMSANWEAGHSLDDFASRIAGSVVPLKWRTVREYLTEWNKMRSTGTP